MDLLRGNKKLFTYHLAVEAYNPFAPDPGSALSLFLKVNRAAWRGFGPGSCRVVDVQQVGFGPLTPAGTIGHAEFAVKVGYRPDGWISGVEGGGRRRLNGWWQEVRDETPDGTPLDGRGRPLPLPPGSDPVYLRFRTAEWGDFDAVDFGELVGEC